MDTSIDKALNLGFGFVIFVLALSIFMRMNDAISDHIHIAEGQFQTQDKVQVVESTTTKTTVTKAYLFYQLTEAEDLEIYINGVHYPIVRDYIGIRSMTLAMRAITSDTFTVKEEVNGEGRLVRLYYMGQ